MSINEENKIMYQCQKCNNEIELPELIDDSWSCNNPVNLDQWVIYLNRQHPDSVLPITLENIKEWDKSELIDLQPKIFESNFISWNKKLMCCGSLKPKELRDQLINDFQMIENNECPNCSSYIDIDQEKCIECGHINPLVDLGVI